MKQLARISGLALAALMFAGCGDETTNVTGLQTVANLQEAGKCVVGDVVLNLEDSQVYVCGADGKWGVLKGEKGDPGNDGAPGEQGIPGVKGEDGSSCAAQIIAEGIEVSCGGVVVDTLRNVHKPDILQWGANYTAVTINDVIRFSIAYLVDANGIEDIKDYAWDFGDGTTLHKTDSSSVEHAYAEPGEYEVSIKLTDNNGDSARKSLMVEVILGEPTVDAGGAKTCYNATPCTISATARDDNAGSQTGHGSIVLREWDFDGDGIVDTCSQSNSGTIRHTYPDAAANMAYKMKFCATDDDGNRVCDTTTVNVSNRAPTLSGKVMAVIRGDLGRNAILRTDSLTLTDPEGNQLDSLWWDLDNDGVFETAKRWSDSVLFEADGQNMSYAIRIRGKDHWGSWSNVVTTTFANRAPNLAGSIVVIGDEHGERFVLRSDSLTLTDPEGNQLDSLWWDLDNDGVFETAKSFADSVLLVPTTYKMYTVSVRGKDMWGALSYASSTDVIPGVCVGKDPSVCGYFVDARDGREYRRVKIGLQTWMGQNLEFGTRIDAAVDQGDATALSAEKFCYANDSGACDKGGYYQWHTVMALPQLYDGVHAAAEIQSPHRGICPEGWHVPTSDEWYSLIALVEGNSAPLTGLSWGGTDNYGFDAQPLGVLSRPSDRLIDWLGFGEWTDWWTSSVIEDPVTRVTIFVNGYDGVIELGENNNPEDGRRAAMPIRCVMDD